MKRLHIHLTVEDLEISRNFYEAIFGAAPTKIKDDYLQWILDEPSVNFAITAGEKKLGLNHLGIQVGSDSELHEIEDRLLHAKISGQTQEEAQCCYASSKKYWVEDPQGIVWENYHTMEQIEVFGGDTFTGGIDKCVPSFSKNGQWSASGCC